MKGGSFVLTPLTPGDIKPDTGTASFCCWTDAHIMRDGQAIDINNPQMTLTGKHGTLVARNQIEFVDLPDGLAVFTGTWKVIRGTGDYAGLSGGGRGAGVELGNGNESAVRRLPQSEVAHPRVDIDAFVEAVSGGLGQVSARADVYRDMLNSSSRARSGPVDLL